MERLVVAFMVSFFATTAAAPVFVDVGRKLHALDTGSLRKVGRNGVPRLGGVAILLGFILGMAAVVLLDPDLASALRESRIFSVGVGLGGLIIVGIGLCDDIVGCRGRVKLAFQLAAAGVAVAAGFSIARIEIPFLFSFDLGVLGPVVAVFWIVGIINAINLIDGLDGLAAGLSTCALIPVLVSAVYMNDLLMLAIGVLLLGALLGFLCYNFAPARIFMGDTGSMFLGFVLAVTTIQTSHKSAATVAFLVPVLALGIPVLDTFLSILRRLARGRSIFVPDASHLHHRLIARGLTHRKAVFVLYGFGVLFALGGVALSFERGFLSGLVLLVATGAAILLMRVTGYVPSNWAELRDHWRGNREIRERNTEIRRGLKKVEGTLGLLEGAEEVRWFLERVRRAAMAHRAALTLQLGDDRFVTWQARGGDGGQERSHRGPIHFPLTEKMNGREEGLTLEWTRFDPFEGGAVLIMERACRNWRRPLLRAVAAAGAHGMPDGCAAANGSQFSCAHSGSDMCRELRCWEYHAAARSDDV